MLNGLEGIEGLSEEQIKSLNALGAGMKNKNDELLAKLSGHKSAQDGNAAELEALKQFKTNADIKIAEDAKNWEEASRLKDEAHQAELKKLMETGAASTALVEKLLIDNGLSDSLDGVNINPSLKAGAIAMLKGQVTIADSKAVIGDKSLSDHVKEWAGSDMGKSYCLAPDNSGTGSNGSGEHLNGEKSFKDMNLTEKTQLANDDPLKYAELSKA